MNREQRTPSEEDFVVRSAAEPTAGPGNTVVVVAGGLAALAGAVGFAVGLGFRAGPGVLGGSLAVAFAGLALSVRRLFASIYPQMEVSEPRKHHVGGSPPVALVRPVRRRNVLAGFLAGVGAIVGATLLAPVTSLAERRLRVPLVTPWREGVLLMDDEGRMLRPDDVPTGGLVRAWPADAPRHELAAVALIRLPEGQTPQTPTNLDWVVDGGVVAYSQVCTHAGCPVALYQPLRGQLFCPCHQASFDVARGATPTFGPASRPLPQLPLGVDGDGYLVALGDFTEPVGPPVG